MTVDWKQIGDRAYNWYFRTYDDEIDHDSAQESAVDEITIGMEDAGIDFVEAWYLDMPKEHIKQVIQTIGERMRDCEKELGRPISGEFLWPMHTWLSGALFEASKKYGENEFIELKKFIDDVLPNHLPKN